MAKLKATEMLACVADEAIQIYGGMGLMEATCRWSASGATPASSASGKAPPRSSATSSPRLLRRLGA